MRIQCAFNLIHFGCASNVHHNELHVKAPLASFVLCLNSVLFWCPLIKHTSHISTKIVCITLALTVCGLLMWKNALLTVFLPFVPMPFLHYWHVFIICSYFFYKELVNFAYSFVSALSLVGSDSFCLFTDWPLWFTWVGELLYTSNILLLYLKTCVKPGS